MEAHFRFRGLLVKGASDMRWKLLPAVIVALTIVQCASMAIAQQQKPNILVIIGR
jgi:hypothetical protein